MSIKDFFKEDLDGLSATEEHKQFFENATEPNPNEVKHRYVFPSIMAKWMAKIPQKTQYEASMMSTLFMLVGILYFIVISILGTASLTSRIVLTVELIAAFVLLSSQLVTQFQQYQSYCQAMESFKGIGEDFI